MNNEWPLGEWRTASEMMAGHVPHDEKMKAWEQDPDPTTFTDIEVYGHPAANVICPVTLRHYTTTDYSEKKLGDE